MKTQIVEDGDPVTDRLYRAALAHVADTYRTAFSAETALRPRRLAVTLTRDGRVACAAGIRCHDDGFFSQHYMDEPLWEILTRRTGLPVTPGDMLEVGGLACNSPFPAYPTLRAIFDWGRARGIGWGLFTATAEIRRLIVRAQITPLMLARAEAARVPEPGRWGSYYDHDPWVCAFRDPAQAATPPLPRAETA